MAFDGNVNGYGGRAVGIAILVAEGLVQWRWFGAGGEVVRGSSRVCREGLVPFGYTADGIVSGACRNGWVVLGVVYEPRTSFRVSTAWSWSQSRRWTYRRQGPTMLASLTSSLKTRSRPCFSSRVAAECRRSWKRTRQTPDRVEEAARVRSTRSEGPPVNVARTRLGHSSPILLSGK